MDLLANLAIGFDAAITLNNVMYCFAGVLLGTLVGVLPGLGPAATIAMLLPMTFTLPPLSALIMLAGIYYGAQYGGSTTAILINVPGESSSVVTAIDGYAMARKGRAGAALAAAGLGSFFAGCVGTIIIAAFAPPLTELAFKFGPAEYFSLMTLGLVGAVVLASGSLVKAWMILLGLLLGQAGYWDGAWLFDISELTDGIGFVTMRWVCLALPRSSPTCRGRPNTARSYEGGRPVATTRLPTPGPLTASGTALRSILRLPGGGALWRLRPTRWKKSPRGPAGAVRQGNIRGVAAPAPTTPGRRPPSFRC
jgi:TctA family transporter